MDDKTKYIKQIENAVRTVLSVRKNIIKAEQNNKEALQLLFEKIRKTIYDECYVNKLVNCEKKEVRLTPKCEISKVNELVFNNKSVGHVDKSWIYSKKIAAYQKATKSALLWKNGKYVSAPIESFLLQTNNNGSTPKYLYSDIHFSRFSSIGEFYYFFSQNYCDPTYQVRFYMNLNLFKYNSFLPFIRDLTQLLDSYFIPYKLKYPSTTGESRCRADNTVLYVGREHFNLCYLLISSCHNENLFRSNVPFFVKKLNLKGIGFAESPAFGKSFGNRLSGMLTQKIINYFSKFIFSNDIEKMTKSIVNDIIAGRNVTDLFRNEGSNYPYFFSQPLMSSTNNKPLIIEDKFLRSAISIGKLLCSNAILIYSNGTVYCNWLYAIDKMDNVCKGKDCIDSYKLLGDDYQTGKLGIIYFLSVLCFIERSNWIFYQYVKYALKGINETSLNASRIQLIRDLISYSDFEQDKPYTEAVMRDKIYRPVSQNIKSILSELLGKETKTTPYDDAFTPQVKDGFAGIGINLINIYLENKYFSLEPMRYVKKSSDVPIITSPQMSQEVFTSLFNRL